MGPVERATHSHKNVFIFLVCFCFVFQHFQKIFVAMFAAIDGLGVQTRFASDVQKVDAEIVFRGLVWFFLVGGENASWQRERQDTFERKNERGPAE